MRRVADLSALDLGEVGKRSADRASIGVLSSRASPDRVVGEEVGAKAARRYCRHLDAKGPHFLRQAPRQAFHGRLGGGVDAGTGHRRTRSGYIFGAISPARVNADRNLVLPHFPWCGRSCRVQHAGAEESEACAAIHRSLQHCRELHQGQRLWAALTGRTHDRTRPRRRSQIALASREPSTHDSDVVTQGVGGVIHMTFNLTRARADHSRRVRNRKSLRPTCATLRPS